METPTTHSILGASGAHRWIPCPGSAKQSKPLPREEESDYALEGTAGHSLLSNCILGNVEPWTRAGQFIEVENNLGKISKWEVTNEMIDAVSVFMADIKSTHPNPTVWGAETPFHRPEIHPSFYGTCDFWAVEGTTLYVTDFKYGMGVVVEPKENPQLMYYALGALLTHYEKNLTRVVTNVVLKIVQPRAAHSGGTIRQWSLPTVALLEWCDNVLEPAMAKATDSDDLASGDWCRFCPCITRSCAQMFADEKEFLELVKIMEEIRELTNEELSHAKDLHKVLDMRGKKLNGLVFARLQSGQTIPSYKLVKSKTNRTWKDGAKLALQLRFGAKAMNEPELKSPAQIDKLIGGKKVSVEHAYKPDGGLSVAHESDSRAAISKDTKSLFTGA